MVQIPSENIFTCFFFCSISYIFKWKLILNSCRSKGRTAHKWNTMRRTINKEEKEEQNAISEILFLINFIIIIAIDCTILFVWIYKHTKTASTTRQLSHCARKYFASWIISLWTSFFISAYIHPSSCTQAQKL